MTNPDAIVPDDKDWTWVLERPCTECGFDPAAVAATDVSAMITVNAIEWQEVLKRANVHTRPAPHVWSPLEYACHVRDVFGLYDRRLHLMLHYNAPTFPNWNQDETALADRYADQHPNVVSQQLMTEADSLSKSFAAVRQQDWSRTGLRSDGAKFTIDTFARYLIHDPIHHLHDVGV
jgi:hypothetical protein